MYLIAVLVEESKDLVAMPDYASLAESVAIVNLKVVLLPVVLVDQNLDACLPAVDELVCAVHVADVHVY